jgi:hypothetical protein
MSSYDAKLNAPSGKQDEKQGAEPSGPKDDQAAAEKKEGHINPSAPEDSNATPGTTGDK